MANNLTPLSIKTATKFQFISETMHGPSHKSVS